jgi:AcrR family transcriptional regulator
MDGRRQRGESSRRRILTEASRLFSQHGYAGTSLADIRKATGLPATSLHHHFGSKAGICIAAIERLGETTIADGLRERLRAVDGVDERVRILVRSILRYHRREYATLLLVIRLAMDADDIDPAIRPAVQAVRRSAIDDLASSLAVVFESCDPPMARRQLTATAHRLTCTLDGLLIGHLTNPDGMNPAWSASELEAMVLASATTRR